MSSALSEPYPGHDNDAFGHFYARGAAREPDVHADDPHVLGVVCTCSCPSRWCSWR